MPVSHLKNRVTEEVARFERFERSDASLLFAPLDKVSEFELGLTLGDSFAPVHPAERSSYNPVPDEGISLPPRSAISVEVAEEMKVPLNLFGVIFPKGNLAHIHAVSTPTTKIDPGFAGHLRLLLVNHSSSRVLIKRGQPIASAVFWRTDATAPQPIVDPKTHVQPRRERGWQRIKSFFGRNRANWPIWIALVGVLISLTLGVANYLRANPALRAAPANGASPAPSAAASEPKR